MGNMGHSGPMLSGGKTWRMNGGGGPTGTENHQERKEGHFSHGMLVWRTTAVTPQDQKPPEAQQETMERWQPFKQGLPSKEDSVSGPNVGAIHRLPDLGFEQTLDLGIAVDGGQAFSRSLTCDGSSNHP